MEQLYAVSGILPKGFQGHITYTTVLPEHLVGLRIIATFAKQEPEQTPELRESCKKALAQNCPPQGITEPMLEVFAAMPKSEINVSVFLGESCVGSAHRNQGVKEIYLSATGSSEGFLPCRPSGVARIVLHVLNVLHQNTSYSLCVKEAYL